MKDYYQILEVPIDASQLMIKEQYHFLVHAWHPDKFPNPAQKLKAEARIKEINMAYDVLSNPAKRAEYDRTFRLSRTDYERERYRKEEVETTQQRTEVERREKEETARRAGEEQRRKERAERERTEAERSRTEYEQQQKKRMERERLEAERREAGKYGIEVIICSTCGTINSLAFSRCIKCSKDLIREKPISNPYLSEENEQRQKAEAESLSRQRGYEKQQKEKLEAERRRAENKRQQSEEMEPSNPKAERSRVQRYGIEIIICSSCGTKNSLSFSRCLNCSKDISGEKPVANPYIYNNGIVASK